MMTSKVIEKYRKDKCIPKSQPLSDSQIAEMLKSDKTVHVRDIPLDKDSWKPFIKHITSKRLMKLLYDNNTGLNERYGYWNRYYPISGVQSSGECPKASNNYPASMSRNTNDIFSLICNKEHVLNMYKETKVLVEKLFLKHFLFSYICMPRDTRHDQCQRHIMFQALYKLDITLNGTNTLRGIDQHLFQFYYFMTQVGYTWPQVIEAVKRYAKTDSTFTWYSAKIKEVIPYNKKHNKKHGWYKDITDFTDEQLKLPNSEFQDVLIDNLFGGKVIRAYPMENGVSVFDKEHKKTYNYTVWLNVYPKTGKIVVCPKSS